MSRQRRALVAAAIVGVVGLQPGAGWAAVDGYTGSTDATWDNGANWSLGAKTTGGDDAVFPTPLPGTGGTIALTAGETANSLTFRDAYTLTGGDLTLTSPGRVTVAPTFTATITSALIGAGGLTLASTNALAGGDAQAGGGTLVLGGTNTFTGGVGVTSGTLRYGADANLGAVANVVTLNGGTLQVTAGVTTTARVIAVGAGGGTINLSSTGQYFANAANLLTGSGPLTVTGVAGSNLRLALANSYSGTMTIGTGGNVELGAAGAVAATAPIIVNAGGELDAQNAVTFANPITANGGTLSFENGTTGAYSGTISVGASGLTVGLRDWYNLATVRGGSITGIVSGSGPVSVNSGTGTGGLLTLSGANTYSGQTTVTNSVLRAASGTGLPAATNLNLNGGVFETTAANFTRSLGTAAGQVQVTGGASGFSSAVAAGTVNLGGAGAAVQFGSTNFNPTTLVLNAATATQPLVFANPLDLNGATRTIAVNAALGANTATVGTVISDGTASGAGLTKSGVGGLVLTGANTYTGTTSVTGGVLRAADGTGLPTAGNLTLNGGAFETTTASFSRPSGTAGGQVQLTGGASGFSAGVAGTTVNLGGAGATLQFGSATFNPSPLVVNAATATGTLDFQNGLDLNGTTRTLAGNGTGTNVGTISGVISNSSGTAAGVTVNGTGVLALSGSNTYDGTTTLTTGTLSVGADANLGAGGPVTFGGGTLRVTGTTYQNFGSRTVTYGTAPSFDIADPANTFTTAPAFATGQTLAKTGAGTLALGAATNVLTRLNVTGGTLDLGNNVLQVSNAGSSSIQVPSGNGTINATATGSIQLTVADGDAGAANGSTLTINAPITGAFRYESFFVNNGTGVTVLNNLNNSFTGGLLISSGVVSVPQIGNSGSNGPIGTGTTVTIGNSTTTTGTLRYTGGGEQNNRLIVLAGTTAGGLLDASGTGLVKFNGTVSSSGAGTKTLTLTGTGTGELAGIVSSNSATNLTNITKTGTGAWTLSGANTFSGNVTVSVGNLVVTNSAALGTGTKTITVIPTTNPGSLPSLRLDGSGGAINLPSNLSFTLSYDALNPGPIANAGAIVNVAGNNTIAGNFGITTGGGGAAFNVLGGTLNLTGTITPTATGRAVYLRGDGLGVASGVIANGTTAALPVNRDAGTGTWSLTAANTYTGGTTISAGTLAANNTTGSATGTGPVTVSGTGVLGGSGTIAGAVTINAGGSINPGNSPGTLSIASPLTFGNTGTGTNPTYTAELLPTATPVAGTTNDLIALTGSGANGLLTLSNADRLNLSIAADLPGQTTYTIASFASVVGTFDAVVVNGVNATQNSDPLAANYALVTYNPSNIQVTVANLTAAVPEPTSAGLLGLAAVGLLARRRRRAVH